MLQLGAGEPPVTWVAFKGTILGLSPNGGARTTSATKPTPIGLVAELIGTLGPLPIERVRGKQEDPAELTARPGDFDRTGTPN